MTQPVPINFTFAPPHNVVGPGLPIILTFPTGSPGGNNASLEFFTATNFTLPFYSESYAFPFTIQDGLKIIPMTGQGSINIQEVSGETAFSDDSITGVARTMVGTTVVAAGTFSQRWESQQGLGLAQAIAIRNQAAAGGFTDSDRTQLQAVANSTVLDNLLDNLTLGALTNGPQGGFVAGFIRTPCWGILIRLATIPPDLQPQTPGELYWVPTLAVVQIFRGSDLWLRIPIHTTSKIINLANEGFAVAITNFLLTTFLLNISVQVNFRQGVTGEVFLMSLPI